MTRVLIDKGVLHKRESSPVLKNIENLQESTSMEVQMKYAWLLPSFTAVHGGPSTAFNLKKMNRVHTNLLKGRL